MNVTTKEQCFSEEVRRCRQAQLDWERRSPRERLLPVRALRHLLVRECDGLCAAVARDLGKSAEEAVAGEILPLAAACRFLQGEARRLLRPRRVSSSHRPLWLWPQRDLVFRRPRGVVGIIGTWNYPLYLNGVQILQALTAGNGVLWKPSEVAPSTARLLFELLMRAGYPEDLIQSLPATREAGHALAQADVDHIVFTGSSATGRRLAETLGRRLVSSTLELSGCDATVVLEDADVNLAARAAWFGANLNRGQTCIAARRALVHQSIYSAFGQTLERLVAAAAPVRLALEAQVRQAHRLLEEAQADGGRLLPSNGVNDEGSDPNLCRPALVLDARPEMAICQEASFAPILSVLPFDTITDAVRMHAQCPYGLGASIYTASPDRAVELAAALKVGSVAINDVIVPTAHPATPFGGRGESGWGVTQGEEGLLEMTVPQVVSVRGGKYRPHYDAIQGKPPLSLEGFRALLALSHGATMRERVRGLWSLLTKGRS